MRGVEISRAAKRGFQTGGFPIWTCPSFFVLFCPFRDFPDLSGIFPVCSGMVQGFSRFVLFLFLGLLRAPTRSSPERVRDTIWTFPEKSGKGPRLETPRFGNPPGLASLKKKRGEENLTNNKPPKKGFWTSPSYGTFSTPPQVSVLCFSCTKIHDRADQKLFWRGPKISGECVLWYVFLPPYVLHPPISRPN